jgi:predicted MPP superfamily phosphohydrolase
VTPVVRAPRPARRRIVWMVLAAALLAALLGVLVHAFIVEPGQLIERDYAVAPRDWPAACDDVRVDVVADTHTGSPRNGLDSLQRWVGRLIASDADVVLMAGDYVILSVFMGTYIPAETVAEYLRPLTARKPVYAVLGNHDWWKDGPRVSAAFAAAGVRMIDDTALPVTVRDCRFWLVGLGDLQEGNPDVPGAFAQVTDDAPVIALTHEPDLWPQIPARAALTIAGHTHGGQINPFGLMSPPDFRMGSHRLRGTVVEGGRSLFVSPGIGTSIVPARLGVPPEISRLALRSTPLAEPGTAAAGR